MKYLDLLKEIERRKLKRHRLRLCPYVKSCVPISWYVDKDGAGTCAGLLHKSNNLDCIRMCIFYRDLNTKEIKFLEHFMTPDEALSTAQSLVLTVKASMDYSSSYQSHYEALNKARNNGDKTPSQY